MFLSFLPKLLKVTPKRFFSTSLNNKISYDYIILGSGSAGSVITRRLSEISSNKICLIEAGDWDRNKMDSWKIRMPSALTYNISDDKCNWDFYTTPQKYLNNRRIHQPRGKVLGGSSSINAMVYARGNPLDFNHWNDNLNCPGWSYNDILPYFKKAQKHSKGSNEYRGDKGLLHVKSYDSSDYTNILFDVFNKAGVEAGYDFTEDINGHKQEGFGSFDMTISPNGVRCSASKAYLHEILDKKDSNVDLKLNTIVTKIIFDNKRAIAVEIYDKKKNEYNRIYIENELIISLGSIGSPHLLMLSGIGDPIELRKHNILTDNELPVLDQPLIGKNLQDHLEVYLQYKCLKPITLNKYDNWNINRISIGLKWFLNGSGICGSNQFESGGFIRSNIGISHPDIQFHFIPAAVIGQSTMVQQDAFQLHVGTLREKSTGYIALQSNNPFDAPIINPNYFDNKTEDIDDLRNAVRLGDEIIQQKAFDDFRGEALHSVNLNSDSNLDNWIRNSCHSQYHPSCTLPMGSVVDTNGKLIGLDNIRVCDASIMPSITSSNLNAPTIAIAEKISDSIKGNELLPKENVSYYVAKEWKTKQR